MIAITNEFIVDTNFLRRFWYSPIENGFVFTLARGLNLSRVLFFQLLL
jgi:hypothetical protein